jgi:formamidopyrimidine-DNA glycosylase
MFDDTVFLTDSHQFRAAVTNGVIESSGRRGKYLYVVLTNRNVIIFHFAMTGSMVLKEPSMKATSSSDTAADLHWPPLFTKLELVIEGGYSLAYCDQRRLGHINTCTFENLFDHPPLSSLALDPILDEYTAEEIFEKTQQMTASLKAVLIHQERIFCGIGNGLADEILFQAGIKPSISANKLNLERVRELVAKVASVTRIAVECARNDVDYPEDWLFHLRDKKSAKGQKRLADGSAVQFGMVSGRTTLTVKKKRGDAGATSSSEEISTSKQSSKEEGEDV